MLKSKAKVIYDFKKVTVPEKLLEIVVSKDVLTDAIIDVAERFLTIQEMDDAIMVGDIISADLESNIAKFNKKKTQISIGKGFFHKELEDALLGMRKNEAKIIIVNGCTVSIKIQSIKRRIFPVVTDELIKRLNIEGANTIADYKQHVYSKHVNRLKEHKLSFVTDFILKEVVAQSEYEPLEDEIKVWYDIAIKEYQKMAQQMGIGLEEVLKQTASSKYKDPTMEQCEEFVNEDSIRQAKAQQIGLFYTSQDNVAFNETTYKEKIEEMVQRYGITNEKAEEMVPFYRYLPSAPIEYFGNMINDHYRDKFTTKEP